MPKRSELEEIGYTVEEGEMLRQENEEEMEAVEFNKELIERSRPHLFEVEDSPYTHFESDMLPRQRNRNIKAKLIGWALRALGISTLTFIAALGSLGMFAYTMYEPNGWNYACALTFTIAVFGSLLVTNYWRE